MTKLALIIIIALLYLLCGVAWLSAAPARHSSAYEAGVNAALNMTLLVGAEWRELHVRFSWEQLDNEVARRLRVKRNAPWRTK
jgi:hypothetical protein